MRRSDQPELLDRPGAVTPADLRANLRDIAHYNRLTRMNALLRSLLREAAPGGALRTGLDVGVGAGDFIAGDMRGLAWIGLDMSPEVLIVTRERIPGSPLIAAAAQRLPFADSSVDLVASAQTLHHLDPDDAVAFLRECARVARLAVVILDLARHPLTLAAAWALTRATSRNRLTREDGVRSARRAYTPAESAALAERAGWTGARIRSHAAVRLSVTWVRR